ncbi:MAG: hypothetical protein KDJ16_01105 [Hyphomicrobiales bacterium]|nr:hypothetical protein [Hyphomicrobiales bacterium]
MLLAIPLLIIPLVLYNLVAFGFIGRGGEDPFGQQVFGIDMISGARFSLDIGDMLMLLALVLLFLEILKATRTGAGSIVDHLLSTIVFIIFLVEFLLVGPAATAVFFIIMVMALIDVIAGYSVTIRAARRDFSVGPGQGF